MAISEEPCSLEGGLQLLLSPATFRGHGVCLPVSAPVPPPLSEEGRLGPTPCQHHKILKYERGPHSTSALTEGLVLIALVTILGTVVQTYAPRARPGRELICSVQPVSSPCPWRAQMSGGSVLTGWAGGPAHGASLTQSPSSTPFVALRPGVTQFVSLGFQPMFPLVTLVSSP